MRKYIDSSDRTILVVCSGRQELFFFRNFVCATKYFQLITNNMLIFRFIYF